MSNKIQFSYPIRFLSKRDKLDAATAARPFALQDRVGTLILALMTGYERYHAMVRGEPTDIVPRHPILMGFAVRFLGVKYSEFARDPDTMVEANIRCAEHFGSDQVGVMCDPYREASAYGAQIRYPEDAVPACDKPPLADDPDLSRLKKPDPRRSERMVAGLEAICAYQRRVGGAYSILGWVEGPIAEACDLRGVEKFLIDLVDEPERAEALMDLCVEGAVAFAQAQVECGADVIGIGDAIASQISPRMYAQYVFPRERRLVQAIRETGAAVRLHICGDTTRLLPYMAQLGAQIVDLDWPVDLANARSILGADTVIAGNLDPVAVVMRGAPDRIRNGAREIYAAIGNRHIVTAGCEIPPATPHENLQALCEPIPYQTRSTP